MKTLESSYIYFMVLAMCRYAITLRFSCSLVHISSPWPWPRGHILKSLAPKVMFLALKSQVLENWPVLGSTTALFELLKFCLKTPETSRKIREDLFCFLLRDCLKRFLEDLFCFLLGDCLKEIFEDFFWRTLTPVSLVLASSIPVLGLERVCPRKSCSWPRTLCPRLYLCSLRPPVLMFFQRVYCLIAS